MRFAKLDTKDVVQLIAFEQPTVIQNIVETDEETGLPISRKITVAEDGWIEVPNSVCVGYTSKGKGMFEEPPAPPPSEVDVRTESSRRLQAIFGARDESHLTILISDALRESTKLLRIGEGNWTQEQKARDFVLNQSNDLVDAFDAASKNLRAMPEIPLDFADDKNWPGFPNAV